MRTIWIASGVSISVQVLAVKLTLFLCLFFGQVPLPLRFLIEKRQMPSVQVSAKHRL